MLHEGLNYRFDEYHKYTDVERQREYEANNFAGKLLMPENLIKEKCHEYKSVHKMAKYFGVSEIAMSIRAGNVIEDIRFMV